VSAALPGIVVDLGITDANNMGAAMAPAAVSTLTRYFTLSGTTPADYDLIVTGDLGWEGSRILCDLMEAEGLDIAGRHNDCGKMIFSRNTQDTHCGGSGCGCAAVVLGGYLLPKLKAGKLRRILFMATGAMMSPDSVKQGQSIPGVAHLICLESMLGEKREE
jgi:stage V sporulation protein AD